MNSETIQRMRKLTKTEGDRYEHTDFRNKEKF